MSGSRIVEPDAGKKVDAGADPQPERERELERGDWTQALFDARGSGHNTAERTLGLDNVAQLTLAWRFDDAVAGHPIGPVHATPVVEQGRVYVGAIGGRFYALERDGTLRWQYEARPARSPFASPRGSLTLSPLSPIMGGAVLARDARLVIFGDQDGNVYALDRDTGAERWVKDDVDGHLFGGLIGNSITLVGDTVYVGFSSTEAVGVLLELLVGYECCSFRGLVVAFDASTGREKWRHYTIPEPVALPPERLPYLRGPSGGAIWGPPTYDADTDTLFVGTGQNFSPGPDGKGSAGTDSIVALDASSGALKWAYQATVDDIWEVTRPNPDPQGVYHDVDFGDSPKLYDLAGVGPVVGAGQKSGEYHVLRAADGKPISRTQHVQVAFQLGGFQNLGGYADGLVYQHGGDRIGPPIVDAPYNGTLMALSPDGTGVIWRFDRMSSPLAAGIAIANGVVYVQSPVEETEGQAPESAIYALDAKTGAQLTRLRTPGRTLASVVISDGRLYIGGGNRAVPDIDLDDGGSVSCYALPNGGSTRHPSDRKTGGVSALPE